MRKVQLRKYYEEIRVGQQHCPRCHHPRVYFLGTESYGLYGKGTKEKFHCSQRQCNHTWEEIPGLVAHKQTKKSA